MTHRTHYITDVTRPGRSSEIQANYWIDDKSNWY